MSAREVRHSGQALVEFAFISVIFFMFVLGVVDFGRAVFDYNMLSNAAREGARVGIVSTATVDQMCAQAMATITAPGVDTSTSCAASGDPAVTDAGSLTISVHRGTVADEGDPDSVTLTYVFTPITPLIGNIIQGVTGSQNLTLTTSSSMYVER